MKNLINKNKGFTLIEIFLTASLFGIILVTIFATYASGIRIWKTVKQVNLIADRKFVLTMEKVKREILGYVRNFEDIQFKGDRESFSFPAV
ncbi:MAG: type II secretion system protein, partial [Candidatus Omnitrophota bacterium]